MPDYVNITKRDHITAKISMSQNFIPKSKTQIISGEDIDSLSATECFEKGYELAMSGNYIDAEKAFTNAKNSIRGPRRPPKSPTCGHLKIPRGGHRLVGACRPNPSCGIRVFL